MLIGMRNALMAGKRLPYDAEVEYLESTGTQYIDTGVIPTISDATRIISDVAITSINTSDNNILFGNYDLTGSSSTRQFAFVDTSAKARLAYGTAYGGTISVSTGVRYAFDAVFSAGDSYLLVNGTSSSYGASSASFLPSTGICLFACGYRNSVISPSQMRLFSCKMFSNGVLVRDFQPARFTNEQGQTEGAMYDKVSGQLFRNQGTGAFSWGNDI